MYVCPFCGGDRVVGSAVIDLNTGELIHHHDPRNDWCMDCAEEIEAVDEEEYEQGVDNA